MKQISLSIEELIYCFYSEGYFEEGNALKQVYFSDLNEEKSELMLQISCRSLLAKNLLDYRNHKFTLKAGLAEIISALNYSEQSIKASRHAAGEGEESLSFHFNDNKIIKHSLHFDEQIHRFAVVSLQEASDTIIAFFKVGEAEETESTITMTQEELEEVISSLQDNEKQFDAPQVTGDRKRFKQVLQETGGRLNTLLFLEFNEAKKTLAKDIVMFTSQSANNWVIEKQGRHFEMKPGNKAAISHLLEKHLTNKLEKETTNNGSHR